MKITLVKKADYPELEKLRKIFEISPNGDICVAVGGDGTFIRAARDFEGPILPIRSIEKDTIGYYSDISIEQMDYAVEKLKSGDYSIERLGNKMELSYKGKKYYAVNEAVMNNELEEVRFRVYEIVNGKREEIYPYIMSGDGVLATSVVGSTAYNKSAGGPIILSPEVFCITFINVDGPYKNPIVVDSTRQIEIEVIKYKGKLRYDGIEIGTLKPGDSFRVGLSKKELNVIRFKKYREEFGAKLDRIIKSRMEK